MSNVTRHKHSGLPWLLSLACLVVQILLGSCTDMLETHPYDTHVSGRKHINQANTTLIESKLKGKKQFKFAMISDTQRWYDDTHDVVKALNQRSDIDFVVHGGDLSDFGITNEFVWQRDILEGLHVPYVSIIGNHDCLGNGESTFKTIFGEPNFAFTAGNVRFICLNTNALEFDYSQYIPDFTFLGNELKSLPTDVEKTIFLMHARPYSDVFNNNVCDWFQYVIKQFPKLQFCLNGHNHQLETSDLYNDGVLYYQCPNIQKRIYLTFTIYEEGYDYEAVSF